MALNNAHLIWPVCCEKALNRAVSVLLPGNRISDIGNAIEDEAESGGFSVIRNLTGHGVGFALHEPPAVPSYRNSGQDIEMRPGLVLAIEPILTSGVAALKKMMTYGRLRLKTVQRLYSMSILLQLRKTAADFNKA